MILYIFVLIYIPFNGKFTGEYSCLSVDLVFKRQFSYYLITIYVPGCMLVVVSWVSFWLDPHAVPARVALGVTTLLTMSTQTASINNSLPPVAYTKAIDVWQGVCVTFVFSALLEYALVNYALRGDRSYILRRARARKRRRAGYTGDDDDYDHGEDYDGDVDYGVDFDDSDEDMDGFTEEEQKRLGEGVQHSRDIFQSNTSSNDISYDASKGNKSVLFSQDENDTITHRRRRTENDDNSTLRSGNLSFLPSFGSLRKKSIRNKVKNNILMNPPPLSGTTIQPHSDSSTTPALVLNTIEIPAPLTNPFGTLGSNSNLISSDEPREQVINGGFLSENSIHLDSYKMLNYPSIGTTATTSRQSIQDPIRLEQLGGRKVKMEKAKKN